MRTLPTPTLARFARHRSAAFVAIAALLVQTVAPALDAHRRDRARRTLAEGVLLVDDAELAEVWGGMEYPKMDCPEIAMDGAGEGSDTIPPVEAAAGMGVHMGTGHAVTFETDVSIPLVGTYGLTVSRVQSSHQFDAANDAGETLLGTSWWCNWDSYVYQSGDDVVWVMPNGDRKLFTDREALGGQPGWKYFSVTDEGLSATLKWVFRPETEPPSTDPDAITINFSVIEKIAFASWDGTHGYLVQMKDEAGNTINIDRDDGNDYRIEKVKAHATDGRYLEFGYVSGTNLLEEVRLKSAHDGGLNELLVTYAYGESHPYVPETNLRSVEFPNGMKKLYTYGSNEAYIGGLGDLEFTHVTHAADNDEPMRTLSEKSIYYDTGSGWVEQALYRADWHEHSEGWDSDLGESWIETQYVYDLEAEEWILAHAFEWTLEGDGTAEPYHAQGGTVTFEGNGSYDDAYTADAKGDITAIGYWFDANPSTTPTYKVTRTDYRKVDVQFRPPGYTGVGQDTALAYRESDEGGDTHESYASPTGSADFLGRLTTTVVNTTHGAPQQHLDIAGLMTSYEYNGQRKTTKITDTLGEITTFAYDADGNMTSTLDHMGRLSTYTYYGGAGNYGYRLRSESPEGVLTTSEYDIRGHTTRTLSSTGVVVTYAYTDTDVPWPVLETVTDNLGNRTTYEYDSRALRTGMINPLGKRTTWVYDAGGRLKSVVNPLGHSTEYTYDAHGRLVEFEDERDLLTLYAYDASGRRTTVTQEDSTTTTYAYGETGCGCSGAAPPSKPSAMKTRAGDHFAYTYDVLGRLTQIAYPGASRDVTFDYTAHSTQNPYGALRKVRDPNFAAGWADNYHFEYLYDAYGRPLEERFPDGEKTVVAYDGEGRLQNAKFNASSFVTTYAYDALSRLSVISNSLGQAATYGYYTSAGKKGLPQNLLLSGGFNTTWDYDALLRLSTIKNDPASGSNRHATYAYDDASRITAIDKNTDMGRTFDGWQYTYDHAGQLTRERNLYITEGLEGPVETVGLDQNYTFDAAGNRLTRTGTGTGHEAFGAVGGQTQYNDLNQMRHYAYGATTWVEYTYDSNGALVRRLDKVGAVAFDWNYSWSPDGYMTRAEDQAGTTDIRYTYDWRGRRLEREDETASGNGPKRRYYFSGLTPIAERTGTYGGSYSWSDDVYNTLTGGDLGQVLWRRTGGSTDRALHYDHIGNVVAESNTSGAYTATHEQDAYGRAVLASYSGGWGDNSLHQTAKPWDDASELHYFNARWYDQRVGQFASTAPMPRPREHSYTAFSSMPLTTVDPDGQADVQVCCRPIGAPIASNIFNHCYLKNNTAGVTLGLYPVGGYGHAARNDPRDTGGSCGPPNSLDWCCLMTTGGTIATGTTWLYDIRRHNSNTFVRDVLAACNGDIDPMLPGGMAGSFPRNILRWIIVSDQSSRATRNSSDRRSLARRAAWPLTLFSLIFVAFALLTSERSGRTSNLMGTADWRPVVLSHGGIVHPGVSRHLVFGRRTGLEMLANGPIPHTRAGDAVFFLLPRDRWSTNSLTGGVSLAEVHLWMAPPTMRNVAGIDIAYELDAIAGSPNGRLVGIWSYSGTTVGGEVVVSNGSASGAPLFSLGDVQAIHLFRLSPEGSMAVIRVVIRIDGKDRMELRVVRLSDGAVVFSSGDMEGWVLAEETHILTRDYEDSLAIVNLSTGTKSPLVKAMAVGVSNSGWQAYWETVENGVCSGRKMLRWDSSEAAFVAREDVVLAGLSKDRFSSFSSWSPSDEILAIGINEYEGIGGVERANHRMVFLVSSKHGTTTLAYDDRVERSVEAKDYNIAQVFWCEE